jgi:hypothetical protein
VLAKARETLAAKRPAALRSFSLEASCAASSPLKAARRATCQAS